MDTERLEQRKSELQAAVQRLEEACAEPFSTLVRDSVIQRFEFCWELAWKTMGLWLEYLGIVVLNPRDTFREAHNKGLIQDGNLWTDMQKMRNLTVHTYKEKLADEVYAFILNKGLPLFRQLSETSKTWQPKA